MRRKLPPLLALLFVVLAGLLAASLATGQVSAASITTFTFTFTDPDQVFTRADGGKLTVPGQTHTTTATATVPTVTETTPGTSTTSPTTTTTASTTTASTTTTTSPPPPPPPPPPPSLGIPKFGQTVDGNDMCCASAERQDFQVAAYRDLHAKVVRTSCGNASAGGSKGVAFTSKFTAVGIRPLCLIGAAGQGWGYGGSKTVSNMASECTVAAMNFGAKGAIIEPINEPDLSGWLGHFDQLAQMQKACYDAVKRVNPALLVVSSGFWNGNQQNSTWINNMATYFAAGGGQYEDALNIHCYNDPQAHGAWSIWDMTFGSGGAGFYDTTNVRSLMASRGLSSQPIICTEGGETIAKVSQATQATIYQHSMATVDGTGTGYRKLASWFAFTLYDDSQSCCSGFGELNPDRTQRPAYATFKSNAVAAGQ